MAKMSKDKNKTDCEKDKAREKKVKWRMAENKNGKNKNVMYFTAPILLYMQKEVSAAGLKNTVLRPREMISS